MKPECEAEFWPMTEGFEGKVPCLYLDVLGLVTTGIGNLCDDVRVATAMPFCRQDGTRATADDIAAEHRRIKAKFCGKKGASGCLWPSPCLAHAGWRAAMAATALRLTDEGVKEIVLQKMRVHDADLKKQYPDFEAWPWQAQLAAHSMAWACGSYFGGSHRGGFPRLKAALLAGDFAKASAECHINEAGNPGVVPRNKKNKELFLEAAKAVAPPAPSFDLNDTRGLQGALAHLGYDPGPIDGIPGKKTKTAIVAFQSARGLAPDGVPGPKTRAALAEALA